MHFTRRVKKSNNGSERRIDELERENAALKEQLKRGTTPGLSDFDQRDAEYDIYFLFFNTLKDFFWILDEQGSIIFVNDYVVNRLHYSREELYKMNVLSVHPEERRDEAFKIVMAMLAGISEFCPIPLVTREGQYIPVETRVVAGIWHNRQVVFGVSKDISELRLSEEKFSKAFNIDTNLLAISEYETGRYLDVNQKFMDTLKLKREEVIGRTSVELNIFDPETRRTIIEKVSDSEALID
ncbi:MAG: PAS domain S-box protein, partial [Prolixibacteraceae bacterium]